MTELGEVEEVDLREQWQREDRDFTPWLADNLDILEDVIDLDLELKDTEVPVGSYNADILAQPTQEEAGDVVIENELGKSDHAHLGKIITYAAGLDASYIVWICERISEEHEAAVDWLNNNFSRDVGFIALEIKLWRIGDSKPAPKFNLVSKPDEWSKFVKSTSTGELTETKRLQREFWSELKEYMEEEGTSLSLRKPRPQHWYDFSIGIRDFKISLVINSRDENARCELYIKKNGTEKLRKLKEDRVDIEEECGAELEWQELEEKEASRIAQKRDFDLYNRGEWEDTFAWFRERAEKFYGVFKPRAKEISGS